MQICLLRSGALCGRREGPVFEVHPRLHATLGAAEAGGKHEGTAGSDPNHVAAQCD